MASHQEERRLFQTRVDYYAGINRRTCSPQVALLYPVKINWNPTFLYQYVIVGQRALSRTKNQGMLSLATRLHRAVHSDGASSSDLHSTGDGASTMQRRKPFSGSPRTGDLLFGRNKTAEARKLTRYERSGFLSKYGHWFSCRSVRTDGSPEARSEGQRPLILGSHIPGCRCVE